ncbi:MAG: hypothetical protein ACTSRE_15690 [Promethearchaeota archaeon]
MIKITGQVPEQVLYNNEVYALAGVKGIGLFSPEEFGITPQMASTACWRGFQMGYKIDKGELLLNWMFIRTDLSNPPSINEVDGQIVTEEYSMFSHRYEGLNIKSHFTGKFLIGKDFIRDLYVHMGFQKPITYKTVLEVFVEEGTVIEIKDRSVENEKFRKEAQHFDPEKESVQKFVHDSFSLDYDL